MAPASVFHCSSASTPTSPGPGRWIAPVFTATRISVWMVAAWEQIMRFKEMLMPRFFFGVLASAVKTTAPRAVVLWAAVIVALSGALMSGCGGSSTESKQLSQAVTANRLGITSTYLADNNGYVHING